MNGNGKQTMTVEVRAPLMVFLGGYLLPHGSFAVAPSPVAPAVCDVTVVRDHPCLPQRVRELFEQTAPDATELPLELQGGRVFQGVPAQGGGSVFVELGLRGLTLVKMPKPAESTAPEDSGTIVA